MTDNPQPAPELSDAQKNELRQHVEEVGQIVQLGRQTFGTKTFDEASQVIADTLGRDKAQEMMVLARGLDNPHQVLMELGQHPERLKTLSRLNPMQQAAELARLEARLDPNGVRPPGVDRAWKSPGLHSGRLNDEEWRSGAADSLSDEEWSRQFNRRRRESRS
jgi:hypothetical protein